LIHFFSDENIKSDVIRTLNMYGPKKQKLVAVDRAEYEEWLER
jgi:hypothetical protein